MNDEPLPVFAQLRLTFEDARLKRRIVLKPPVPAESTDKDERPAKNAPEIADGTT